MSGHFFKSFKLNKTTLADRAEKLFDWEQIKLKN